MINVFSANIPDAIRIFYLADQWTDVAFTNYNLEDSTLDNNQDFLKRNIKQSFRP